jgi:hypothetical protein
VSNHKELFGWYLSYSMLDMCHCPVFFDSTQKCYEFWINDNCYIVHNINNMIENNIVIKFPEL